YMLLGTLPDDALLQAAADGRLSTIAEVAEQVRRLAGTPRFAERVVEFHERWMQLGELTSVTKDDLTYPEFSAEFLESARLEARSFIEEVTLVQGGTVGALLTAPFGFVDERLAGVYDLGGSFGPGPVRVEHPASAERRGLFTQAAFLTGHSSSSSGTSPILRGVFLLRRVACENIPDPPPGAQMQEPSIAPAQ